MEREEREIRQGEMGKDQSKEEGRRRVGRGTER